MLKTHLSEILADASNLLRAWALVDGTECVVAVTGRFLELRVVDDDTILRSARFTEVQPALDTAQLWRIKWDTGWSRHIAEDPAVSPVPHAEAPAAAPMDDGPLGCRCPFCGYPWKIPGVRDQSGN
jgi:hypothetical protein